MEIAHANVLVDRGGSTCTIYSFMFEKNGLRKMFSKDIVVAGTDSTLEYGMHFEVVQLSLLERLRYNMQWILNLKLTVPLVEFTVEIS